MGLADRHYMRGTGRGALAMPFWLLILIINVGVFFAQHSQGARSYSAFMEYGALSPDGLKRGMIWQFLTFQFLHAGTTHLFFNLLTLWSFGRPLEMMLGKRKFLSLYLLSGFVGGIAQILLSLVSQQFDAPMVGASAGICGLIAAFALLHPDSIIYVMFIIPVRALYFLPLAIGVSLLLLIASATTDTDHVAHGAHLGGILAGVAWVKFGWHLEYARYPWDTLLERFHQWRPFRSRRRKRELVKAASLKSGPWSRGKSANPTVVPEEEFISREVDPILDKISAHGIQSLTEQERKILEAARSKMGKR